MPGYLPDQWQRDASPTSDAASRSRGLSRPASHPTLIKSTLDVDGWYFSVFGARYVAPRLQQTRQDLTLPQTVGLTLTTVFPVPSDRSTEISDEWIRKHLDEYKQDDVFNEAFLANVVFLEPRKGHGFDRHSITKEAFQLLEDHGMKQCVFNSSASYLPGPHVMVDQELREVWKLVDDSNGTCMVTLKPQQDSSDAWEALLIKGQDNHVLNFALPSRIKSSLQNLPLAGLRILIKDNIHLKGVKTSVGSRAFYDTFPPQEKSAPCIQVLINKGAVIAGKTKLSSFGNWEEPIEYIDYQAPWNPRADGCQSPGGSSSGSASAIVAYDWLDIAIGTDTWGSITRPAHWCGCFGLRPSIGSICADGIEPCVQSWDIPGILARDLQTCKKFAEEWLDFSEFAKAPESFTSIIWPSDFWKIIDIKQTSLAKSFAQNMATNLGVKFEEISFEERWQQAPPMSDAPLLSDFISPSAAGLAYDAYHNGKDFRCRYWDLFKRAPYTTVQYQRLWDAGEKITEKERNDGFDRIDIYRKWFQQTILTGDHTNAITIMPLESAAPRYRDDIPEFQRPPQAGINCLALGPVMKSPVLAIPIAEVPYHSRVSQREEKLPFAVALMGTPGTDLKLLDTAIRILPSLNVPTTVRTGRSIYGDQ
ncbi:amidase signature domain-containing protein [Trichoderma chlorosporum]